MDRYRFFNCKQKPNENIESFVTTLKTKAQVCQFGEQEESLVRDLLIIGINDNALKERLLMEHNLKLDTAIQYCRAKEESVSHVKEMNNSLKPKDSFYSDTTESPIHSVSKPYSVNSNPVSAYCSRCLTKHAYRNCPAWGKKCNKCKKLNHFASACKAKVINSLEQTIEPSLEDENIFTIKSVFSVNSIKSGWNQKIVVGGTPIDFKLDTGAEVNVLPLEYFNKIDHHCMLKPTAKLLKSYSGHKIKVKGVCWLECKLLNSTHICKTEFFVVDELACPILGLLTCQELNLISRINYVSDDNIVEEFNDVFNDRKKKC
jgi:hypothetical protein